MLTFIIILLRLKSQEEHQEAKDKLDYTDKQLNLLTSEIKDKIRQMTEEVEKRVSVTVWNKHLRSTLI